MVIGFLGSQQGNLEVERKEKTAAAQPEFR